jgi:SIR2-like protein
MVDIKTGDGIPYGQLAQDVFPTSDPRRQKFVPFLGAGVSISGRTFKPDPAFANPPPDREEMDRAISCLRLEGKGKTFIELAILLAYLVQIGETSGLPESEQDFYERIKNDEYPPSAPELAELFGLRVRYTSFERIVKALRQRFPGQLLTATEKEQIQTLQLLAKVTRIANPPESLTSIASYYEKFLGRQPMWELLREIISGKKTPTPTHKMLAQAAGYHLKKNPASDYLIITTNYDCLMEQALDETGDGIPYIVLTTRKGTDPKVLMRCSKTVKDGEALRNENSNREYPGSFTLSDMKQSLVAIYKIHGCLSPELQFSDDGVVISDNDYVDYVSQMSTRGGMIPSYVSRLMRRKPLWFLGYSLSDWNVRSIYETVKAKSDPDGIIKDYSVMYSVGDFESLFFEKSNITIFQTGLNEFVKGIMSNLPKGVDL